MPVLHQSHSTNPLFAKQKRKMAPQAKQIWVTGGELIQVPGTCIERVKLIDPGFSKIKKVMGVLVLKTFSLYILYGGKIIFFVWDNALAKIRKIEKREKV